MTETATSNTLESVLGELEESIDLFKQFAGRNYTTPFDAGLHARISRLEVLAQELGRRIAERIRETPV